MLSTLKKSWKRYRLNRSINKQKFKLQLQKRDNQIFAMNIILFTLMIIFLLSAIIFFLIGPFNVWSYYSYQTSKNDDVVKVVVDYCNYQNSSEDKVWCVNRFVNDNFDYMVTKQVINPDDLIKNGGDCKSWTNFYIVTLKQMGVSIRQDYESVDKHTFAIADIENGYCIIDQRSVDCNYLVIN